MTFEPEVKVGEVRVFADTPEPLTAVVLEARGLSGYRIVPVSPYPVPASDRELTIGARVFQLWNACTAAKGWTARSWVADTLSASELEKLREALVSVSQLPPFRMGDYERRCAVRGGDFRSWSKRCPEKSSRTVSHWNPVAWSIAASVVLGLGVAWLLSQRDGEPVSTARVWTLQMQKPEEPLTPLAKADAEPPESPGPFPKVEVNVPPIDSPALVRTETAPSVQPVADAPRPPAAVAVAGLTTPRDPVVVGKPAAGAREAEVLDILRGLRTAQRQDGSWGENPLRDTALGVLALMAHGETPGSVEFGAALVKGVRYLTEAKLDGQARQDVQIAACALCGASLVTRNPNVRMAAERAFKSIGDGRSVEAGRDWSGVLTDLMSEANRQNAGKRGYDAAMPPDADKTAAACLFVLQQLKK